LIDIDPEDLQMSFREFQAAHAKHRFVFAILVHVYGWASARVREFREFCGANGVGLLEDGAQSYGVTLSEGGASRAGGGEPIFKGARVGTLSFYPAKVVGGCMDGGGITTVDEKLAATIRSLCNHGRSGHYSYQHIGWNSRMGGLQAGFLLKILPHTSAMLESRRKAVDYYFRRFSKDSRVRVYGAPAGIQGNGYLSVIEVLSKPLAEVTTALQAAGIGFGRVYPETMDQQPPATGAIRFGELAVSRRVCASVLSLPVFDGITVEEYTRAADVFERALG
jgi:dTDP-4-amino-4,6-dideoxygalactose transaminase